MLSEYDKKEERFLKLEEKIFISDQCEDSDLQEFEELQEYFCEAGFSASEGEANPFLPLSSPWACWQSGHDSKQLENTEL